MFRFAILGAGKIAVKFADAVRHIEDCEVCAVGSRNIERAQVFAEKNGISKAYGSYEELLDTERPDAVYIANLPSAHYETAMLCMSRNVPVICEKAMFQNADEAEKAFAESEKRNVFMMEALWSKFLPANAKAKQWLDEGRIGKVAFTDCSIGFCAPEDPENRYFNPKLGGGAALDITVYAYEITAYMLGCEPETDAVKVTRYATGVDGSELVSMHAGDVIATVRTSFVSGINDGFIAYGNKGKIVVPHPHWANEAFLYDGNGELVEHFKDGDTENGFVYEAGEVVKCVKEGLIESAVQTHAATINCAKLFDMIHGA